MLFQLAIPFLLCLSALLSPSVLAQQALPAVAESAAAAGSGGVNDSVDPPAAAAQNGEGGGAPAVPAASTPAWRSTAGYRFQAIAQTVADLQNLAHAMNLRELCANQRVPDAFVRQQLDRFSAISGREEDCRTLLDY